MGVTIIPSTDWESRLEPPKPVASVKMGHYGAQYLPHDDLDGKYWNLSATSLYMYSATGATSWNITPSADVNANCDYFSPLMWYDTTDSAIWIWAVDTGTTPDTYYLAKVALSDGTVTNIGTCQPSNSYNGGSSAIIYKSYTSRASMGSGNITHRVGNNQIVLSTADGSIVSETTGVLQSSVGVPSDAGYETADGEIYTRMFGTRAISSYYVGDSFGGIMRGGQQVYVVFPPNSPSVSDDQANPIYLFGDKVCMYGVSGYRFNGVLFERSDFDAWLHRIADYYNLP